MTPTATADLERLARASRPGEWRNTLVNVSERGIRTDAGYICFLPKPQHYDGQDERYAEEMAEYEATAAYIAAVSPDVVLGMIAALRAAEAERDSALAALKPFAALADEIEKMSRQSGIPTHDWAKVCVWDDLLRARAALQSTSAKEGE